jgi:NCS2 family nucleobase:cation symporter-2
VLFAMIFSSGTRIINQNVTLNQRNSTILALSMALGLGVAFRPEVLQQFPTEVQTLFGSALVTGGMAALLLNIVLPGGSVGVGETEYTTGITPDRDAPDASTADD